MKQSVQEKKNSIKLIIIGSLGLILSFIFKSVKKDFFGEYYFYKQNNMNVEIKFFCIKFFGLEVPLSFLIFVFLTFLSLGVWFLTIKDKDFDLKELKNKLFCFFKQLYLRANDFLNKPILKKVNEKSKNYNVQKPELMKVDYLKRVAFISGIIVSIISFLLLRSSFTPDTFWMLIALNLVIRIGSLYFCYYLSKYNIWHTWIWLLLGFIAPPIGLLLAGMPSTVKEIYSSDNLK